MFQFIKVKVVGKGVAGSLMLTAALAVNLCKSGTLIHLASVLDGLTSFSLFQGEGETPLRVCCQGYWCAGWDLNPQLTA
jgi:hypothetical protein